MTSDNGDGTRVTGLKLEGMRVYAVKGSSDKQVELYDFGTYIGMRQRDSGPEITPSIREGIRRSILKQDAQPGIDLVSILRIKRSYTMSEEEIEQEVAGYKARVAADRALPMEMRVENRVRELMSKAYIQLDCGFEVWGDQVLWGPFDKWERYVKGREVVPALLPGSARRWRA